jgi:DNA transposition AAA+ family ATPase
MSTAEFKQNVVNSLVQKIKVTGVSQNYAAQTMGISSATLSNAINNKWDNISEEMWRMMGSYAGVKNTNWPIIGTYNYKSIAELCDDAKANSRFLAVAGATGLGKTEALKQFSSSTPNCFYVLCTSTMNRADFIKAIQRSMGVTFDGKVHDRLVTIIDSMRKLESPVLILDDCGKLKDDCLLSIQIIYDELVEHAGIVIAGTEAFKRDFLKKAVRDRNGFRELKRRIAYWQKLQEPSLAAVKTLCVHYNIDDENVHRYIQNTCKDYGTIKELILNANRAGGAVTVELIRSLKIGGDIQ